MQSLVIPPQYADLILVSGEEAYTTSVIVAEKFGRRHDHVLRAIENLECPPASREKNFISETYLDVQGKERPIVRMTERGTMLLAMSFTGQKAAEWRELFLDAFYYYRAEAHRLFEEQVLFKAACVKATIEHDPTKIAARMTEDSLRSELEAKRKCQEMKNERDDIDYENALLKKEIAELKKSRGIK